MSAGTYYKNTIYQIALLHGEKEEHKHISNEQIEEMLMKPEEESAEFIGSMFSILEKDVKRPDFKALIHESPESVRRRKDAFLQNADRYMRMASDMKLWSATASFVNLELFPIITVTDVEQDRHINLAAALWLLNELYMSGKIKKAYEFLPEYIEDVDLWTPTAFYHPCFSQELVDCATQVIADEDMSPQFNALLNLLDSEQTEKAVNSFKELQDKAVLAYLKAQEFFDKRRFRIAADLESTTCQGVLFMGKSEEQDNKRQNLACELKKCCDEMHEFEKDFWLYFGNYEKSIMGRRKLAKLMEVKIDNPYEICFGFAVLRHIKDPAVNIQTSTCAALNAAGRLLPWYNCDDDFSPISYMDDISYTDNDWLSQKQPEGVYESYHLIGKDGLNPAQHVYRLSKGIIPFGMQPFDKQRVQMLKDGIDGADHIISWANILFLANTQLDAENLKDDDDFDDYDDEYDYNYDETPAVPPSINEKVSGTRDKEEDIAKLTNELAELRKQNKSLKTALAETRKNYKTEAERIKKELAGRRQEHRELADLRELAYNLENNLFYDDNNEQATETDIKFPYSPKLRTVIFGGHDSFLREIRQKLPDVTYVSTRLYNFDPSIIRNADVVWIQNNAISHSQYWRAIDIAKKYNVQLRYFTYASAHKCAMTLAEWDRKNE